MKNILLLLLILVCFTTCTRQTSTYLIGVSQCSNDEWRNKMNNEILREALFYDDNVQIEIRTANDNNQRQIEDIRYFIDKGVDLLVVAPNESVPMTPIIEEAYDKGIPVIVIDRKIFSNKYTAFIGADNYEIGKAVGNYITSCLNGKGKIVELTGLTGSTPAIDRHQGFINAISHFPDIQLLAIEDAEWLQYPAEEKMEQLLDTFPEIDLVFSQNDRMAIGAYLAAQKKGREKEILFVGIDAIPEKHYGVDQVVNGVLEATFIYPTGGDKVIQTAMDILKGNPFERDNILSTAIVDKTNARIMKYQTDHITELGGKIELINNRMSSYLNKYNTQQLVLYACLIILVLFITLFLVMWRTYKNKITLNQELSDRNNKISQQNEQLEVQRDHLIALSKQLEEATHAKLVFFTNISHDFRTPLTLIADPVEQLLADTDKSDRQHRMLTIIQKNVNILLRLVNQILDFRKYESGKLEFNPTPARLDELINDWNNAFTSTAYKKHIKFTVTTGKQPIAVNIDIEKIERVYFNLLSNAFKFTPENGRIQVKLDTCPKNGKQFAQLVISDTGIGIPVEHIKNIFDRFYKIDSGFSGSGIGLAVVKAFIELHGGEITVESKENKGTIFTIILPMPENSITPVASSARPSSEENSQEKTYRKITDLSPEERPEAPANDASDKPTLLIVDDNEEIRSYVKELLEDEFIVMEAENGQKGIQKAMKYVPDIIICDIMMPVMDGMECCRILKSELQTSHIPIILLTSCSLDEQRIQGFESGADSYISKPFNSKLLEVRLHNLINNRQRLRQFFGDKLTLAKESISDIDKGFVERFKAMIEENLSNSDLSVEELGEHMGMSRVQLYRKVKSLTNYAPNELLRIARLKKAASLLASSSLSVSEITYEVGFTSPSYFSKCYKDYFGESPSDFLKRKDGDKRGVRLKKAKQIVNKYLNK